MSSDFSKPYNPKETEEKIYQLWEKSGFFNPDKILKTKDKRGKAKYSIVIPPPNITGELHMGHALNVFIQDILIRFKRMQDYKALWLPGTDHAGIATQNVVEKELKKAGLTRHDLGREKFLARVWAWQKKYGHLILEQLKKMGCSCDWSRTRFTLDKNYQRAVETAFLYYYNKEWIYQGERLINWCPRCETSLSDLELEYEEEKSKLWYIKYPLANVMASQAKPSRGKQPATGWPGLGLTEAGHDNYITVATTRPETMLGDTALSVHPKDKRYQKLIGRKVILPLVNRQIPIIADKIVEPEFGTGAVKVTPAHDPNDFEMGQKHNLEMPKVIDEKGRMTDLVPAAYQKLTILEAREKIVADLQKQGFLEKIEDYTHRVAHCYRCQTTIEPLLSQQWFLKMNQLAKKAMAVVKNGQIKFHPKRWEKVYFDWLTNIKDWCISRQLWWGHRLPVWQCQTKRNPKSQIRNSKQKEKYFISLTKPKKCPVCGKCQPQQIPDVLDTWFSSALWPLASLGWPKQTKDLKNFYPTDVLVTARDIINLWVARMVFSSLELMKKIPFSHIYIHATILTKEGQRMSKSLGTGQDPLDLVKQYGADATRFGLIYQSFGGQDIHFSEENIKMGQKFCNKVWNAARFVLGQIENLKLKTRNLKQQLKTQNLTPADKKILKQLKLTTKKVTQNLENYRFGQAAHILYDFFWHDFCDQYIEASKRQNTPATKQVLAYIFLNSLRLLHPFLPFITESIYQKMPFKEKKLLMIEQWSN